MAKGTYVFLFLSLLTARFAFVSAQSGYCGSLSGEFHGACWDWRDGECYYICKNAELQSYGECEGSTCYCFHPC
ncbi:hypothetical protein SUGI_0909310 [Cryptomeria japonica]|nr:hypothetical protein SUGI_0909310 [Cryptomeria japonica]